MKGDVIEWQTCEHINQLALFYDKFHHWAAHGREQMKERQRLHLKKESIFQFPLLYLLTDLKNKQKKKPAT